MCLLLTCTRLFKRLLSRLAVDYQRFDFDGLFAAFLRIHLLEQLLSQLWGLLQKVLQAVKRNVVLLLLMHVRHLDCSLRFGGLLVWLCGL